MAKIENPVVIVSGGEAPTVYFSTYGRMYMTEVTLPDTCPVTSIPAYNGSTEMRVFSSLSTAATKIGNQSYATYEFDNCPNMSRYYLPYVTEVGRLCITVPAKHPQETGEIQVGSLNNPVTAIGSDAFFLGGHGRGTGWQINVYTTAETKADAMTLLPNAPWGAVYASYTFYNSTTGEELV